LPLDHALNPCYIWCQLATRLLRQGMPDNLSQDVLRSTTSPLQDPGCVADCRAPATRITAPIGEYRMSDMTPADDPAPSACARTITTSSLQTSTLDCGRFRPSGKMGKSQINSEDKHCESQIVGRDSSCCILGWRHSCTSRGRLCGYNLGYSSFKYVRRRGRRMRFMGMRRRHFRRRLRLPTGSQKPSPYSTVRSDAAACGTRVNDD
jgi:hypothetical protein